MDSRPPKPQGVALSDLRDDWQQRALDLGYYPGRLIRRVVSQRLETADIGQTVADRMVASAIESLDERQSSWRPAELVRELAAAVPTTTTVACSDLTATLDRLAVEVADSRCVDISRRIPDGVELRRDGRPVTEPAVDRALTTRTILDEEEELETWAQRRHGQRPQRVARLVAALGRGLSSDQVAAASAVAGRGDLELIVGPAGAGKTTALAAAVKTLRLQQRAVFGAAPTATAAEVLATETGMAADTLDKLLTEHALTDRPLSPEYDLPARATLIVDEAGTIPTPKLAELAWLADEKQWRVVLVGDPRQLAAVGRGGMFGHLVDTLGPVDLDQVHRFTQEWEKRASLRLRSGDPTVLDTYQDHGRIHSGTFEEMQARIVVGWKQARDAGHTVALLANSNETVSRLNNKCQDLLVDGGDLDPAGRSMKIEDQILYEGDQVVTRRNDRTLRTSKGLMVKNRDHWTINRIHDDGTVTVTGPTGAVTLPADYVNGHVELGYAQTSHASQGRTVDTALLLIDTPTDSRGIYTPMTRGRHANQAYVAVEDNQTGVDVLAHSVSREWADTPAVARRTQLTPDPQPSGLGQDDCLNRADSLGRLIDRRASRRPTERVPLGVEL